MIGLQSYPLKCASAVMGEGDVEKVLGSGRGIRLQYHHHLGTLSETDCHSTPVLVRTKNKQWPYYSICSQHTCLYTDKGAPSEESIWCPTMLAVFLLFAWFSIWPGPLSLQSQNTGVHAQMTH